MFAAFHLIKCILVSASLLVGSAAFVPFAPKTLSCKKTVTHFSIPKPSSSSLVVVIQQISPATTSSTALNVETNNFDFTSAGFAVALATFAVTLAGLIVAVVMLVGSSLDKRLDGIGTQMVSNKADLEKLIVANKVDLDKRLDGMEKRIDGIDTQLNGLNTSFITYLGTERK